MPTLSPPYRMSTSKARERLSDIVTHVQDPRTYLVLTRHDKPVAAIVSMAELDRIWKQEDIEDIIHNGRRPSKWTFGTGGHLTNQEAAEAIQQRQLDRRMEREVLAKAGLEPIPGGEVAEEIEMEVPAEVKPWWRFW